MLPSSICRLARFITLCTPVMCWVMPIAHSTAIGLVAPMISAACSSCSTGTPVISDTTLRCVLLQVGFELLEAFRALVDESLVLPALFQDDMHQAIDQGVIRAGLMSQVNAWRTPSAGCGAGRRRSTPPRAA